MTETSKSFTVSPPAAARIDGDGSANFMITDLEREKVVPLVGFRERKGDIQLE